MMSVGQGVRAVNQKLDAEFVARAKVRAEARVKEISQHPRSKVAVRKARAELEKYRAENRVKKLEHA